MQGAQRGVQNKIKEALGHTEGLTLGWLGDFFERADSLLFEQGAAKEAKTIMSSELL